LKPVFLAGLHHLGHDRGERRRESARLHWQPYARPIGPKAFADQLAHLDNAQTQAVAGALKRLDLPAQVVWAEHDPLGMGSAERLAAELHAPLTRVPGARHFTPEDHPDVLAEAIRAVLAAGAAG
jgi:pimeloyl-ACP methyl ester carboxylesterase